MLIRIVKYSFIVILSANIMFADDFINEAKINKLLKQYNFNKNDLILPKDRIHFYNNNNNLIKEYFANPSKAFENLNSYADRINNSSTLDIIKEGIQFLELKKSRELPLGSSISTNIMNIELGTNIDSLIDYKSSLILRPYLNTIINSQNLIIKDLLQKDNGASNFLRDFTENLIKIHENDSVNIQKEEFDKHIKIFDNTTIFEVAYNLYLQLSLNNERLKNLPDDMKKDARTTIISTKYGKIGIGGIGNDVYNGNFIAIIDLGGDDNYNLEQFDNQLAYYSPIRFIVDFEGNDKYNGKHHNLGGAYFGVNIIIDYKGNDIYKADNYSIASGIFGLGLIEDSEGNDKYINQNFGISSSFYGIGLLIDKKGDDYYESQNYSQSFSSTKGFSILKDNDGNDTYTFNTKGGEYLQAASRGNRVSESGSIAFILDNDGKDKYNSRYKSQSFASDNALVALKDYNGDDEYRALIFSQSSAEKHSVSLLYDLVGNDKYYQPFAYQANSRLYSYSMFVDKDGDDKYIESENKPNDIFASLFIDEIGNDTLKFNKNYQRNDGNFTLSLNRMKLESAQLIKTIEFDSTSIDRLININDKVIEPEYSQSLQSALKFYITDTLLFEQIKENIDKLNYSDRAVFAYYYLKSAKNDNLMKASFEFIMDNNDFISQSAFDGLIINPSFTSDLLLKLMSSEMKLSYKKLLSDLFASINFSRQSTKEFRKEILNLPNEIKLIVYPNIKLNNSSKSMKGKIKDLIKNEKDVELKKLLQNEK